MATYYARHREAMLAQQKEYHEAHREEALAYNREYYLQVLKPKRQLQRQHNATRWSVKPEKKEPIRRMRRHIAPLPTPKPPPAPKAKRVRKEKPHVYSCRGGKRHGAGRPPKRAPGPLIVISGPRLITWD